MPKKRERPKRQNRSIYIASILSVGLICLGVWAFLRYSPPDIVHYNSELSLIEMEDVVLNGNTDEGREWVLKASGMEISRDRTRATVQNIADCTFFRKKKPVATLKAANAVVNLVDHRLSVFGNVKIFNSAGQSVQTSALTWEPNSSTISSAGPVLYKSADADVHAEKLEINIETGEMTLQKPRVSLWIEEVGRLK